VRHDLKFYPRKVTKVQQSLPRDHELSTNIGRLMVLVRKLFSAHKVPRDIFLWGHLKALAYEYRPKDLEELKATVIEEIMAILREMTEGTMQSFRSPLFCLCHQRRSSYARNCLSHINSTPVE